MYAWKSIMPPAQAPNHNHKRPTYLFTSAQKLNRKKRGF